jgi:hypothetical protein
VSTDCAGASLQLVVHEQRKGAVPVVKGSETVGNADHPVAADRVADGEDRLRDDSGLRTHTVGRLRTARTSDCVGECRTHRDGGNDDDAAEQAKATDLLALAQISPSLVV